MIDLPAGWRLDKCSSERGLTTVIVSHVGDNCTLEFVACRLKSNEAISDGFKVALPMVQAALAVRKPPTET